MSKKEKERILALVAEAVELAQSVCDSMQERFDEKSDAWKESDKGQEIEGKIAAVQDAITSLESAASEIEELEV
jgi:hypothetical protein